LESPIGIDAGTIPTILYFISLINSKVGKRTDKRRFRVLIINPVPDIHYDPRSSCEVYIPGGGSSSGNREFNTGISTDLQGSE
jgi:hypothetical protein